MTKISITFGQNKSSSQYLSPYTNSYGFTISTIKGCKDGTIFVKDGIRTKETDESALKTLIKVHDSEKKEQNWSKEKYKKELMRNIENNKLQDYYANYLQIERKKKLEKLNKIK